MTAPARTAAYRALTAIDGGRLDLPTALVGTRRGLPDDRDRGLAADIVAGTLRWRRALDHLIEQISGRPLGKVDAEILTILRLSLYQILHLDRVPASAVVDDAVDLARAAKKVSATGFVNAVLRTAVRQRHKLPLPERPKAGDVEAAVRYLGITHSHPDWLVRRLIARHGFDAAERWAQFDNDTPLLTIRANRLRTTRAALAAALRADDVETEPTRYAPDGLVITAGNPLRGDLDGSFFVQDEASQLVALLVGAQPGERVLDLCASPGGKTVAIASDMQDAGLLVATDVRPKRVALLQGTVARAGARCVRLAHVARSAALPFGAVFDRVLVDAPCSGLGTIRRDPDIRWRRSEDELPVLAEAQSRLLDRAAAVVRPGGVLVYSTCSSEPEENDGVVDAFLDRHPEYEPVDPGAERPADVLATFSGPDGRFRTLPFAHGLEAFFGAVLRRRR